MDLAYFRAHPDHIQAFLTHQRIRETPVSGGSSSQAQRLTFDDGASVFAKSLRSAPDGFFAAQGSGLTWLAAADAVGIPEVIAVQPRLLVLAWVEHAEPSATVAERFGRELAALHRSGAPGFGAPWAGFVGALPLDNTASAGPWPEWFATHRIEPYLRTATDRGALTSADGAAVHRVLSRITEIAGPAGTEPAARIHGDLRPDHVLWSADRVWLVDPAAHGGHRETDLAMLALCGGVPLADRVLAAYTEVWPLSDGWRERMPLHQLYPLLVRAAIGGAGARDAVLSATRSLR